MVNVPGTRTRQCIVPCKVIQNQFWDAKIFCTGFCGLQVTRLSVPVLLDWILECSILDSRAEMFGRRLAEGLVSIMKHSWIT